MNREDVKVGSPYRHRKHKTVEWVENIGKYRKEDGTWVEGVSYSGIDRFTGEEEHFFRTMESFCEDFEIV